MVTTNPSRAGRWHNYQTMSEEERIALTEDSNFRFEQRRAVFEGRSIHAERGLKINEIPDPLVPQIAEQRGWTNYVTDPPCYDPELVIDFYAAMIPPVFEEFFSVVVRGTFVRITPDAICAHFGVQRPNNHGLIHGLTPIPGVRPDNHYSPVLAAALRRNENPEWVPRQSNLKKNQLRVDIALWLKWIKHNLTPSTHDNTVNAYVAKILYHIQMGLPMDIGRIIQLQIIDAAANTNTSGILPFPCMITRFCREAGCDVGVLMPPLAAFDRHTYREQLTAARRANEEDAFNREGRNMRVPAGVDDMDADEEDDDDMDYNPAADLGDFEPARDIPGLSHQMQRMHVHWNQRFDALEEGRIYGARVPNPNEAGPSTRSSDPNPRAPQRARRQPNVSRRRRRDE